MEFFVRMRSLDIGDVKVGRETRNRAVLVRNGWA